MFLFNRTNINEAVGECRSIPDAILLDVREADEYRSGHIPDAVNVPLSQIGAIDIPKDKPLYVYCLRGTRSKMAVNILKQMGYDAKSIGGIASYRGQVERFVSAEENAGDERDVHDHMSVVLRHHFFGFILADLGITTFHAITIHHLPHRTAGHKKHDEKSTAHRFMSLTSV